MASKTKSAPKRTASYTTTSGKKVVKYSDGSKSYDGVKQGGQTSSSIPTSARGDEFAQSYLDSGMGFGDAPEAGGQRAGESRADAKNRIENRSFSMAGSPTVMTNANLIERVVPLLNSQANGLSQTQGDINYGDSTYSDASGGESFDEIIGLTEKKKKKKQSPEDVITEMGAQDPMLNAQFQLMDRIAQSQDRATREYIKRTKETFNRREAEQKQSNESTLNQVKQALNLGGSSRYAPISSAGIISSKEQQGIQALADLDSQENQLIAEAKQAQQDKDYQLLESKLGLINEVRKEKQTAASELEQATRETEAVNARESMIADMVMQGITNPVEIFQNLQASGTQASLADVTTALKGLNEFGGAGMFQLEQKQIGQLLGAGLTAPDIQAMQKDLASGASLDDILSGLDSDVQGAVRKAFGAEVSGNKAMTIGVGANSATEEAFIRTRLFSKIAPILNKGALSEPDREIIDSRIEDFRAAGFGEQEILDTIAGLPPEINTPYNSTFRDLIVSNSDTIEKQGQNIGRLSQQLSKGNYQQAMNTVENLAMSESKKLDPDNYMSTGSAQFSLNTAKELRTLLNDAEDVLGPLEGTFEQIKGKLAKSKDPRATKIQAAIVKLTAPMRNQLSGTAVTSSETSFLEPLIPSISDNIENIYAKADALESQTLDRLNSTRSIVSLPEVTKEMVIDPKKRLVLYSNDIYYKPQGQLDI